MNRGKNGTGRRSGLVSALLELNMTLDDSSIITIVHSKVENGIKAT